MRTMAVVLAALSVAGAGHSAYIPWTDHPDGTHWYEAIWTRMSWTNAKANAEARGGYLCTITSQAEYNWLSDTTGPFTVPINVTSGPWLGGTDAETDDTPYTDEGNWRWVSGEAWGAWEESYWLNGKPDDGQWATDQDYLHWHSPRVGHAGQWDDSVEYLLTYSIVEYNSDPSAPVPEPASCALLALAVGGVGVGLKRRRKK